MKISEATFKELSLLKEKFVSGCKVCNGLGYILKKSGGLQRCNCMVVFRYISRLVYSGIPKEYWGLSFKDLVIDDVYKEILGAYIENIDSALEKAKGFLFIGPNGVGKTAMLCELGKEFIIRGEVIKYFTAEQYIDALRTDNTDFISDALSAHVHLLDEVGKNYIKQGSDFVVNKFEEYLRKALVNTVVIGSTNFLESELLELFGESVLSVMKRHLKFVEVHGEDFSNALQRDWLDDLKSKFDYFSPNIVSAANRMEEVFWREND